VTWGIKIWKKDKISVRTQLAGEANSRIATGAHTVEHEGFSL